MNFDDNLQRLQDEEYEFPYHYVAQYGSSFSQCFNDTWGINYVSTIEFLLERMAIGGFESAIDIGCGDGRFTREMFRKFNNKSIVGIDYSANAINLAKAMNPQIDFCCMDITQTKLSRQFDVGILMEVLEHIPINYLEIFITSVSELLNSNGIIHITVPHKNKSLEYKHYTHFTVMDLVELLGNHFLILEVFFLEKKTIMKSILDTILTNNIFILNNNFLKQRIFNYYKKNLFIADSEQNCKRLYLKAKKNNCMG